MFKILKMSNYVESIVDLDCSTVDEAVALASQYFNKLHPFDRFKLDFFDVWQFDESDFDSDGYPLENRGFIVYSFV